MSLVLWGRPDSSNVAKVMWLLEELGLAHEHHEQVGGKHGFPDDYASLHPLKRVPAVQLDGVRLWESHSIMRRLALSAGDQTLYPAWDQGGAEVDAWLDWQLAAMATPQRRVFQTLARGGPGYSEADAADLAGAMATVAEHLQGPYLLGGRLTIADIAIAPNAHRWIEMTNWPTGEHPALGAPPARLAAWRDGLRVHPGFERIASAPVA